MRKITWAFLLIFFKSISYSTLAFKGAYAVDAGFITSSIFISTLVDIWIKTNVWANYNNFKKWIDMACTESGSTDENWIKFTLYVPKRDITNQ